MSCETVQDMMFITPLYQQHASNTLASRVHGTPATHAEFLCDRTTQCHVHVVCVLCRGREEACRDQGKPLGRQHLGLRRLFVFSHLRSRQPRIPSAPPWTTAAVAERRHAATGTPSSCRHAAFDNTARPIAATPLSATLGCLRHTSCRRLGL